MKKEVFVFTDNFPFGISEAFLNSEAVFLPKYFDEVHYIPLWKNGEMRDVPQGSIVERPLLGFNPKGNIKLVVKGLLNFSPFFFAIPVFFKEKAWKGRKRFWDFMTALLIIRATYSSLKIQFKEKDLVYSYWGDKLALLLPLLKKKFGIVAVSRFHRTDLYEDACNGFKPFRRWLFDSLDAAVPIAENGKRYLEERYGNEAPRNIVVHRLGVFDHGLNPEGKELAFQIVSCSHVVPVKRVVFLAKVVSSLGFKVNWTHIGDGPLRADVEAVITKFPENVTGVLLGAMPNEKVLEYYATHHVDLFVNVSESEGVPVSIMEALSFGIPVIATDVGGVSEIVDDMVGNLLPADVNEQQLKAFIEQYYSRDDKKTICENARKHWAERSDAIKNYSSFCEFLTQL
jgi:glycosyltransferase involved in cell wall biosynthesis